MSKADDKYLIQFLKPFSKPLQDLVMQLRSIVWDWYPHANELIYDNYNALAFGWSVSDRLPFTFCTMAVFSTYMHFGFYDGKTLTDPKKILLGKGNQYRYIVIKDINSFPKAYMRKLLKESYSQASFKLFLADEKTSIKLKGKKLPSHPKGMTIVKSISPKKRRPE